MKFVKEVLHFIKKDAMHLHAAAISFFAIFAFIPLIALTYLLYTKISETVATELLITAADTLGSETTNLFITIAKDISVSTVSGWTYAIGIIVILYGMTRLMYFLQKSMNKIWNTKPPENPWKNELYHRLLSVLSIFALIILTTLISLQKMTINQLQKIFGQNLSEILFFVASAIAMYSLIALLYKFIPDRVIKWSDVIWGATFSTILFWAGYIIMGTIMQQGLIGNVYATIGLALLALVWIYYFAQIFYIGAEINKVYALHYGSMKNKKREFK